MEMLRRNRYIMNDKKDILLVTLIDFFLSLISKKNKSINMNDIKNILIAGSGKPKKPFRFSRIIFCNGNHNINK